MCVRFKALYMKHYNNTQPNLTVHDILLLCISLYEYIPHSPLHPQMRTCTHAYIATHTLSQPLSSLSLSPFLVHECAL